VLARALAVVGREDDHRIGRQRRILFTDSPDEAMDRIMSAATQELGLVWEAKSRWYFGESGLKTGTPGAVEVELLLLGALLCA
jgi:hypothetical protein